MNDKKRVIILFACLVPMLGSAKPQLQAGIGVDMGLGATAQLAKRIELMVGNAGVAGDYRFYTQPITNTQIHNSFYWYVGGGVGYYWSHWAYHDDDSRVAARLPVGLNVAFNSQWQGYAQLVPTLMLGDKTYIAIGAAIGVRYDFWA